ncbi:MAG: FadR family transcriptional regulator [Beijerinckiaceae bacterium]|nr:FadR family transcriptional regulator [Beijerinckiaceae bacterium]
MPQLIAARLQQAIADGQFPPGAQLPSQRELSDTFGVSRASLREAVSTLAALGLVAIKPGLGVFVTAPEDRVPLWRFSNAASARDVYEARLALEGTAAALAAGRMSDLALTAIASLVDDLDAALQRQDLVAMTVADAAFHDLIVDAAKNPVIASMYRSARDLMVETQRAPMATRGRLTETVAEHKAILSALEARDARLAGETMERHIRGSAHRLGLPL